MNYIEIAVSNGPGTLVSHGVFGTYGTFDMLGTIENEAALGDGIEPSINSLTPTEYLDFIEMHGGTVAV